jgi:16S rRNA (guanine(966)-N(2))-methyltransferase RsmD
MRVIAGEMKGRKLSAPVGLEVRPTSDKVKGALFNILGPAIVGASFLDLYAGTGAIGIESLSRGAARVVFVEEQVEPRRCIQKNLAMGNWGLRARVVGQRAERFVKAGGEAFDFIFIDPPYQSDEIEVILPLLAAGDMISPVSDAVERTRTGQVIVEHFHKKLLPETVAGLKRFRSDRYGDTILSFYVR